jgi:hypothetical protein
MVTQAWALMSQLVLPLAEAKPIDVMFASMPEAQWGAGLAAAAAGLIAFLAGSMKLRFYLLWLGCALAPFTLWELNQAGPRYVYLAALPFAIVLAWCVVGLGASLAASMSRLPPLARAFARPVSGLAIAACFIASLVFCGREIQARNGAWTRQVANYGVLADGLQAELPEPKPGTRIVILNGQWTNFWATATARAIYGERNLSVIVVLPEHVSLPRPAPTERDILLRFTGSEFVIAEAPGERRSDLR